MQCLQQVLKKIIYHYLRQVSGQALALSEEDEFHKLTWQAALFFVKFWEHSQNFTGLQDSQ